MESRRDIEALAAVIGALGQPNFYAAFSTYLRSYLSFDNIVVIRFDGDSVPDILYKEISGPDVFNLIDTDYMTGAYLLDPVYQYHLERKPSGIFGLLQIAPDQFKRSRYYEWYYGRIGIIDEISIIKTIGDQLTVTISMGKDLSTNEMFSQKNEHHIRDMEPVIMQMIDRHLSQDTRIHSQSVEGIALSVELASMVKSKLDIDLSRRQAEVALLILRGHSSTSIGLNLEISPQTVKVFRKQLYKKCNLSSQAELFAIMMPLLAKIKSN